MEMTDVNINGVKKLSPDRGKIAVKLDVKHSKLAAQEKLRDSVKILEESLVKTKEAFVYFQTKCFFYPEPEFSKAFRESLQQVESGVTDMGSRLGKLRHTNEKGEQKERKSTTEEEQVDTSTDQSAILAKANLNITPPVSEPGNDDELTVTQLPAKTPGRKRNGELSSQVAVTQQPEKTSGRKLNVGLTYQAVKKPRRSLIDDYLVREKDLKDETQANGDTKESLPNEEVLYEVENIITYKRHGPEYLYKVSWKGYGPEDCTWEPSEHLENCSEVLIEFYKQVLTEREKDSRSVEYFGASCPIDKSLQKYLYEAFFTLLQNEYRRDSNPPNLKSLLSKTLMSKEDMYELADKALHAKKVECYKNFKEKLKCEVIAQTIQNERSKQLAQLRGWERMMNSICKDPARIQVENDIDLALPPLDFIYINELKDGQGVTVPNDPLCGCECTDCFSSRNSCCASQSNSWFAYNKHGRLRVSLGTPVYECNKRCPCPPTCPNRVVQKGRIFSLSIFRTDNGRGWGVKTLEPIKKDSFVVEYVGEVITSEEAEHRGQVYDKTGCTYLFDLDFDKGDQNLYTVDATKYGNVSHFINHSCDPNLVVFNVWVNCLDPDLPRLALFACKDIKKGEEITFDYNSGIGSDQMTAESPDFSEDDTPVKGAEKGLPLGPNANIILKTPKGNRGLKYGKTECRCGAANCRKYFF
ncbi:histone-lysine N-methyltransferase SUV39H2-like [Palaemon carinicauda]|uniref:histone-lysine N-methyltransferase SUV39H2-like n=1 Tax=Palaemon carinicauda TaxID=392227 RepID=UPI0035B5737C